MSNGNLFSNSLPTRGQRLRRWVDHAVQLLRRTPPLVFAMAVLGLGLTTASGVLVNGIRKANDTITMTTGTSGWGLLARRDGWGCCSWRNGGSLGP